MKRTLHLSSLILLAWGCARSAGEPPPAGGQSGDDGDAVPEPNHPVEPTPPGTPMLPESPCDPQETQFAWDALTPFGGSALDLLARLAPGQSSSPLFWVPFDSLSGTRFQPGPSQAALSLSLDARGAERVKQLRWQPKSAQAICPDDALRLPVRVTLQSTDGALDEQVDGLLELTSGSTAHLSAELPGTLGGNLSFDQIGAVGENWQSEGFNLAVDLWPGGSQGELYPSFTRIELAPSGAPNSPPSPAQPPPAISATPPNNVGVHPSVPSHWRAIAVWPRRENCDGEPRGTAAAHAPDDRAIGLSLVDVVNELNSQPGWTLLSGERTTQVRFTLDTPNGLQCVRASGRSVTFDVQATVSSDATAGAPLAHLAATSVFEVTATPTLAGATLERLHWVRRDVVQALSRAAFEAATGLTLASPAEYQQVWWSWHGTEVRASPDAAWAPRLELVVSSLNTAQSAETARVVAQGGPGAGISFDTATQFPELPGDALIRAGLVPAEPLKPGTTAP